MPQQHWSTGWINIHTNSEDQYVYATREDAIQALIDNANDDGTLESSYLCSIFVEAVPIRRRLRDAPGRHHLVQVHNLGDAAEDEIRERRRDAEAAAAEGRALRGRQM